MSFKCLRLALPSTLAEYLASSPAFWHSFVTLKSYEALLSVPKYRLLTRRLKFCACSRKGWISLHQLKFHPDTQGCPFWCLFFFFKITLCSSTGWRYSLCWCEGLLAEGGKLQKFESPRPVSYKGTQKLSGYYPWWWALNVHQHFPASWAAAGLPAQMHKMTAWGCRRYLHGAICACCVTWSSKFAQTGGYLQGRVLQRQGSKEKKWKQFSLDTWCPFQGNIQRTNHANPNSREISLHFFIWCSEIQPTIHTSSIPEVTVHCWFIGNAYWITGDSTLWNDYKPVISWWERDNLLQNAEAR